MRNPYLRRAVVHSFPVKDETEKFNNLILVDQVELNYRRTFVSEFSYIN